VAREPEMTPGPSTWNGVERREPFSLEDRVPDHGGYCPDCFRDWDQCPGHDTDPEAEDIMHALVNALHSLPGLHPVPKSIVIEINRCEDYLRKHAKET
jgi:hypothetical protein